MASRYCIVGAGYTGLAVAKAFADAGLDYHHVEATGAIGGNWSHGVYDSTHLISCRDATQYADYPMPANYPDFPSAAQMLDYLRDFARHFRLDERIEFDTLITRVEPIDPRGLTGWRVTFANGNVRRYTGVVVANGHYWSTRTPNYPGTFAGNQIHSKDYRRPADLTGPRVLVVGAGNSGCDLAVESATTFGSSDLSLRRAYWFLPKYVLGVPSSKFDVLSVPVPKFLEEVAFRALVLVGMGRFSSFGLEKPRHRFFEQDLVVNQQLPYFLKHGRVRIRPEITRFDSHTVHFADGSAADFDTIVWATGFNTSFPFLPDGLLEWEKGQPRLVAHSIAPGLANLMFAGLVAPRSGAGGLLTESSRVLAQLACLQQRVDLPIADLGAFVERPRASILAGGPELRWQTRKVAALLRTLDQILTVRSLFDKETDLMRVPEPTPGAWAVVTGASAGIGEQLARQLAAAGHDVLLVARRLDRLESLAAEIRDASGVRTDVISCDLSDRADRETLVKDLPERKVSVLCNNAGFATFGDLKDADPIHERNEVEVNVNAVQDLTLAVLPQMIARRSGAILITGSTAGHQPFPGNATYAASKAFANTFAESLHAELAGTGVTCTLLAPGPVATEFNEVAQLGTGIDAALGLVSISAKNTAAQALSGLATGRRSVVPGLMSKLQTVGGRYTPRRVLLPVLHRVARGIS